MGSRTQDHDRAADPPDPDATAGLVTALGRLRLAGAIFLRGDYTESWAYESMPSADAAALLAPGAQQVILFHVIASGRCWIEAGDAERVWAGAGDVIVIPYNDAHRMGGAHSAPLVSITALIDPPPWERMPVVRHGGGGVQTGVVCGYLACDDPLFDPRLRVFPPAFVVTPPAGPAREWVTASIDYALASTAADPDGRIRGPTDLPALLLREVLRIHLASAPTQRGWWGAAVRDPVLGPALAALHASPERKWSVVDLAREAHASVSLLDQRFREQLGLAPIRYLTGWRMHLAEDLLRTGDLGVATVARKVGYDSEEAFSRAFKRVHGTPPAAWRARAAAAAAVPPA